MKKNSNKKRKWFSVTKNDCIWTYYRGSGSGGQKRNKTENAARCFHKPSGAVGCAEDTRSKDKNKQLAFKRMAESKEFQSWLSFKIEAGLGKIEIQEGDRPLRKLSMEEV